MISALRQKSNFELFWKKNPILGFPWCSTREDHSIDVSIINVGLILTKLWWYLFSGCGQTDRQTDGQTDTVLESSHGNMSAHKKFQLKTQNLWLAVDPYMPPRRSGMHKYQTPYASNHYASPTSGEAYRNRRLTTNFELWVEIFCVPTCFHVRIPKPCLSVRPSVCLSAPREKISS